VKEKFVINMMMVSRKSFLIHSYFQQFAMVMILSLMADLSDVLLMDYGVLLIMNGNFNEFYFSRLICINKDVIGALS